MHLRLACLTVYEYLVVLRPVRLEMLVESTPEEAAIVGEHFRRYKEYADKGVILLAGRTLHTDETSIGIMIFRAESQEEAQAFLDADPAIIKGIMTGVVYPYRVAILSESYPRP
jgi:uncharacterized protein